MRGLVSVLVCVAALVASSWAQLPGAGGPGHGGQGHGGHGHNFPGAAGPVSPDPNRKEVCAKFWMHEGDSCYLFDSGAFLRRVAANTPVIINNQDGLYQSAANQYCARMHPNATLVTVNNLQENNFLYEWAVNMMVQPVSVWIGLHTGPTGQWQWYSGEPVNYTNWEGMQPVSPEPGLGAVIFDADIINQLFNNQVEITPQWVAKHGRNEPHAIICEYHPSAPTAPATTASANRGPVRLQNLLGDGRFGGSLLHEVPRSQQNRPANYRMNP